MGEYEYNEDAGMWEDMMAEERGQGDWLPRARAGLTTSNGGWGRRNRDEGGVGNWCCPILSSESMKEMGIFGVGPGRTRCRRAGGMRRLHNDFAVVVCELGELGL